MIFLFIERLNQTRFTLAGFDTLKINLNVSINEILSNMLLNHRFAKCVIKIENPFVLKSLYMYIKRLCFKMKQHTI